MENASNARATPPRYRARDVASDRATERPLRTALRGHNVRAMLCEAVLTSASFAGGRIRGLTVDNFADFGRPLGKYQRFDGRAAPFSVKIPDFGPKLAEIPLYTPARALKFDFWPILGDFPAKTAKIGDFGRYSRKTAPKRRPGPEIGILADFWSLLRVIGARKDSRTGRRI